jgi:KaiC/GvpD/RAD55 family RecA-like ATPase
LRLLRYFTRKTPRGVYVTLNKPYATLLKSFSKSGISVESVFFVDEITDVPSTQEDATHAYLGSGVDLSNLSISISKAIKQIEEDRFLLLDSLSTLLIYYDAKAVVRFAHNGGNEFRTGCGLAALAFLRQGREDMSSPQGGTISLMALDS